MADAVEFRWSGQVMESIDGLAFIGHNPGDKSNVYIATGDSGQGMTHGTIAGILITDLIRQRPNPWTALYDPSRKPLKAIGDFLSENLNVAKEYLDYLKPSAANSPADVPRGQGAILRRGIHRVAVYHDLDGRSVELSAICRHLGCIVQWNTLEKSWDCPCHGSRFDAHGRILNGPANSDLPPAQTAQS